MKVKLQDLVLVRSGKDKGKKGKITKTFKKKEKIVVEKINLKTKHVKKTNQKSGEIIKFEAPIPASKVMVICPHCAKPTRVGYKKTEKGKKFRICKKCNESIDKKN